MAQFPFSLWFDKIGNPFIYNISKKLFETINDAFQTFVSFYSPIQLDVIHGNGIYCIIALFRPISFR